MPPRSLTVRLNLIGSALSAFLSVAIPIRDAVYWIFTSPDKPLLLTKTHWIIGCVALAVLAVVLLLNARAQRSVLRRTDGLDLLPDDPRLIEGRADEIAALVQLCRMHPQVNVTGAAGAGKTTLLSVGLVPLLKKEPGYGLLPVYLDVWGKDWEEGPRRSLALSLWVALNSTQRETLGLTQPPAPDEVSAVLGRVQRQLGLSPLCIFDQFDDYQILHRQRFLPPETRTWLRPEEVCERNRFWQDIDSLLSDDIIRLLIVTRSDNADGLDSVRFAAPQGYPLDGLDVSDASLILDQVASQPADDPVVYNPDRGWKQLCGRLCRDLVSNGRVLPAQMKVAIKGLKHLAYLTPGDYERSGGLHGLEAVHIESILAIAARSGIRKDELLTLLHEMVRLPDCKTVPRSQADLCGALTDAAVSKQVDKALELMEGYKLVRRSIDPDSGAVLWGLDHDYLCHGIVAAQQRSNGLVNTLREHQQELTESDGALSWWRALIPPGRQLALGWGRLRGRFRYGSYRAVAAASLLRLFPYAVVLLLCVLGPREVRRQWRAQVDEQRAHAIIETSCAPSVQASTLWDLATESAAVRLRIVEDAMAQQQHWSCLTDPMKLHALVGLDAALRKEILTLLDHCLESDQTLPLMLACVSAAYHLDAYAAGRPSAQATKVVQRALEDSSLHGQAEPLASAWGLIRSSGPNQNQSATVPPEQPSLAATVERIVSNEGAAKGAMVQGLSPVLTAAIAKAEPKQAMAHLLESLARATNIYQIETLGAGLASISGQLSEEQAQQVLASLPEVADKVNQPFWWGWAAPLGKLPVTQRTDALRLLLAGSGAAVQSRRARLIYGIVKALSGVTISNEEVNLLYEVCRAGLLDATFGDNYAYGASFIAHSLPTARRQALFSEARRQIAQGLDNPETCERFGPLLAAGAGALTREQARQAVDDLLRFSLRWPAEDDSPLLSTWSAIAQYLTETEAGLVASLFRSWCYGIEPMLDRMSTEDALKWIGTCHPDRRSRKQEHNLLHQIQIKAEMPQLVSWLAGRGPLTRGQVDILVMRRLALADSPEERQFLGALLQLVPQADRRRLWRHILLSLSAMPSETEADSLRFSLRQLGPHGLSPRELIEWLKWPIAVGDTRAVLTSALEQVTGTKFAGGLWQIVSWGLGRTDIDLPTSPARPAWLADEATTW